MKRLFCTSKSKSCVRTDLTLSRGTWCSVCIFVCQAKLTPVCSEPDNRFEDYEIAFLSSLITTHEEENNVVTCRIDVESEFWLS